MLDKTSLVKTETFEKDFKESGVLPACAYAADIIFSIAETLANDKATMNGIPCDVIADVFASSTSMPKDQINKLWGGTGIVSFVDFRQQVIEDRSIARFFKNAFFGSTDGLERKQTAAKIEVPKE